MKSYARILALLLAVIMMVSVFAGCNDVPASSTDPSSSSVEPSSSEPASSEPASSEPASSEPASSEPASSEPASSEPASSEPAEPSTSVVEPDVKDPTKAPTKAPTQAPTKAPTQAANDDKVVDLKGFNLRLRSEGFYAVLNMKNPDKYNKVAIDRINEVTKEYNFKITVTNNNANYQDYNTVVKAIQSGSKTIGHFITTSVPLGLAGCAAGYFQDLNSIDKSTGFVASDESRFWQSMTKTAVYEGKQYGVALLSGSAELTEAAAGVFWLFNKNVLQKGGYSSADVYKLVREYKWTLDEATKIMEACYVPDANGDGEPEVYGLMSYKRQNKYYIQLDGGQTVSKVNGKYVFSATNDNVMSVMNWLKDVYVTKKLAVTTGSSTIRNYVRDGKTVFTQGAPDYLTRGEFSGNYLAAYQANVGIVPSPVGNNQIKKKVYINPTANADIYVMPTLVKGEEKTNAAIAFAALAKAVNNVEDCMQMMQDKGAVYGADNLDMYKNYIMKNACADFGYITEIVGNSDADPISAMVLAITGGSKEPAAAIQHYEGQIVSVINKIFRQ